MEHTLKVGDKVRFYTYDGLGRGHLMDGTVIKPAYGTTMFQLRAQFDNSLHIRTIDRIYPR